MSAFVIHLPTTQPQIIDSRGGLFWCKTGCLVHADKMNIYFKKRHLHQSFRLFGAKRPAIWCKTPCILPLNAVRFGAKCGAFWC